MLTLVVDRVMREEMDQELDDKRDSEPLLHLLHGVPGTGKSYVVKLIREFFEEVMCWNIGGQFHVAALQAVMAVELGGETLHHVSGINPFVSHDGNQQACENLSKKHLFSRWLIIDEISMVSASLLAMVERKFRDAQRESGTYKMNDIGEERSFGGLNVLFVGDFFQIDPPEGMSLSTVPKDILNPENCGGAHVTATAGLNIFWNKGSGSVQGVTELTQAFRCQDVWYNEFLTECREMRLSDTNHRFIHGLPTRVPGSWVNGAAACGDARCQHLPQKWKQDLAAGRSLTELLQDECNFCRKERKARKRVVDDDTVSLLQEKRFVEAPAVVPNNDIKYEAAKRRAIGHARKTKQAIIWCPAKDMASAEALLDEPTLVDKKLEWLQRHDQESGKLYGMLPLFVGLLVTLTDHLDRNPAKNLLRGRKGRVVAWELDERENQCRKTKVMLFCNIYPK